ncbi:MAG: alpha/beta hydrolase [Verrucomicrobiales bacterium]|nr:alpha/beta hydrolase [Verrucomicrobiales bacterium]
MAGEVLAAGPQPLWPGRAPGETKEVGPEVDITKPTDQLIAGRRLIRLGQVGQPTLEVFRPPAGRETGAAVLVCPGGAYHILALDLEGTEVCEWLNSNGVTAVLLKYRVPRREGLEKHAAPLQDAQRAMGLIRQNATAWGIDPKRMGVLGFSAGGHLAATVSVTPDRTYPRVDAADDLPSRPDFTVLVYPAYLTVKEENDRLAPELPLNAQTPPTFLVMAQDDPVRVENALFYSLALKQAGVPMELHLYPSGGHGYGLRRTELPVTSWPDRVADWMKASGWLRPAAK